jgi:hypothetical protein
MDTRLRPICSAPDRGGIGRRCATAAHRLQRQPCDESTGRQKRRRGGDSAARLPFKALGLALPDREIVQVSMNLTIIVRRR